MHNNSPGIFIFAGIEVAIATSLIAVLALIGVSLPSVQVIIGFLWSIPLVVLIMRQGLAAAAVSTAAAFIITLALAGPLGAGIIFVQLAPLGFVYGYLYKIKCPAYRTLALGSATALVSLLITTGLSFIVLGLSPGGWLEGIQGAVIQPLQEYRELGLAEGGLDEAAIAELEESITALFSTLKRLIPGMLVVGTVLIAVINFLISRLVLVRLQYDIPSLPPFRYWRVPWYFIWGVIAGLVLWLFGDYFGYTGLIAAGQNIVYIYAPLATVLGFSIVSFFSKKWKVPGALKVVFFIVLIFFFPYVLAVLSFLGLFDMVVNYRRLPNTGKGELEE